MAIDYRNPISLYLQVAEELRQKISSGEIKVGEKIPSQKELTSVYGVSLITIKKAVALLINEGVLFSRVGKGTYVARTSPVVDISNHKAIGLVLRDLKSPFFSLIVHSVEESASEKGYDILLSSSSDRKEKEDSQIRHFRRIGVSGLLIASMDPDHRATKLVRQLHEENFPYVMVSYVQDPDIFYVGTDHKYGAFIATGHLIKLGYEKLGYISGERGNPLGDVREKGFRRALEEHGLPFKEEFVFHLALKGEWNHYRSGYEIGQEFAQMSERPEAVFAYNDLSALGFEQAVLANGLEVPEDVAIIGFDDIERSLDTPVPLTTVHQPTTKVGTVAVETLITRIDGGETETRILLKPRIVVRDSCGARSRAIPREVGIKAPAVQT